MKQKRRRGPARRRVLVLGAAVLVAAGIAFGPALVAGNGPEKITTDEALTLIEGGSVTEATIAEATAFDGTGKLTLKDGTGKERAANYPSGMAQRVSDELVKKGVKIDTTAPQRNVLLDALLSVLPLLLMAAIILIFMTKSGALGADKFDGVAEGKRPAVHFDDVAGADEAVAEVKEMVEFLRDGERFEAMGARTPKGALLVGPPGTGKTLIAKAAAHEAGLPFFSLAGSDFVEMFAGLGPRRVRKLFKKAREKGGIIFIDEIDVIGVKRSAAGDSGYGHEIQNVIAALLTEMDGFSPRENVLVLAATNRPEVLDEALTRPGRLERKIHVPLPDLKGRERILAVHGKGKPLGADADLDAIARQTVGMSGAELAFVVNEACMRAVRLGHDEVTSADLHDAVNTVAMGRSRDSAFMSDRDRELTAYHEAGHAAVAMLASRGARVSIRPNFVTIVPRGHAGGLTRMNHEETTYISKSTARNMLAATMGGRAAEIQQYGEDDYTSGAHGDLTSATNTATAMVLKYGMSDSGRLIAMDDRAIATSDGRYDALVEAELARALATARDLLDGAEGRDLLETIARALLESETLTERELERIEFEVLGHAPERELEALVATGVDATASASSPPEV